MTALTYDERQDLVSAVYRAELGAPSEPGTVDSQRAHLELLFGLPDHALRQRAARTVAIADEERARDRALRLR
jgi:hypothetical protein